MLQVFNNLSILILSIGKKKKRFHDLILIYKPKTCLNFVFTSSNI